MWKLIGEQLDVKDSDLKCLQQNVAYDDIRKLAEVLQIWRDKRTCDVSWRKIITVIEEPPLETKVVAWNIFHFLARPEIKNEYLLSDQPGKSYKNLDLIIAVVSLCRLCYYNKTSCDKRYNYIDLKKKISILH